jgi:hypothetical protein
MPKSTLTRSSVWHGVGVVSPGFAATWEPFQFAHDGMTVITMHRPKSVSGMVWDVGGRGREDLTPLAELTDQGLRGLSNPTCSIAGHLIAVALTGTDAPENLAPVSTRTNQEMTRVEGKIRKLAQAPLFLEVTIPAYYDGLGEDGRIAKSFVYNLYSLPDRATLLKTFTVNQSWLQPVAYAYPAKEISLYGQLQTGVRFLGWKIEDVTSTPIGGFDLSFLKGHLPPPDQRPNACMDYLLIGRRGEGLFDESVITAYIRSIALGASFPEFTRQMALKCAIVRNHNRLISDASGNRATTLDVGNGVVSELFGPLIEGGGNNGPQVDHIVPEALRGPNCFSNAQITSAHYNASKGKNVDSLRFRDPGWMTAMQKKLLADPNLAAWVG